MPRALHKAKGAFRFASARQAERQAAAGRRQKAGNTEAGVHPSSLLSTRRRGIVVKVLLGLLILSLNMAFSCGPEVERVIVKDLENGGKKKAEEATRRLAALERATSLPEKREDKQEIEKLLRDFREERAGAADENSTKAYAEAEQQIADTELIATIETEDAPRDAEVLKESDDAGLCEPELDALPKGVLCKYLKTYAEAGRAPTDDELGDVFYHSAQHCLMRNYAPEQVQAVRRQLSQLRTYRHIAEAATTAEAAKRLLISAACR